MRSMSDLIRTPLREDIIFKHAVRIYIMTFFGINKLTILDESNYSRVILTYDDRSKAYFK